MKTKFLILALSLIALFSFNTNTAFAQNPQINFSKGAPIITVTDNGDGTWTVRLAYAKFSGLGDAKVVKAFMEVKATGDVTCFNDAQLARGEDGNKTPGQALVVTGETKELTPRNGTLTINGEVFATIKGTCKLAKFHSFVDNLDITSVKISLNGVLIDLSAYIPAGY